MDLFDLAIASKLSGGGGGGGGASNIVFGDFTLATTGAYDVSIPYNGNGYPVTCIIWPEDGFTSAVTDTSYEVCFWGSVKVDKVTEPSYKGPLEPQPNKAYIATTYSRSGSAMGGGAVQGYPYNTDGAKAIANTQWITVFKDKKTMSVYGQESTSYFGFAVGAKYRYMIEYSE